MSSWLRSCWLWPSPRGLFDWKPLFPHVFYRSHFSGCPKCPCHSWLSCCWYQIDALEETSETRNECPKALKSQISLREKERAAKAAQSDKLKGNVRFAEEWASLICRESVNTAYDWMHLRLLVSVLKLLFLQPNLSFKKSLCLSRHSRRRWVESSKMKPVSRSNLC